jgi:apolipoprotein N-acyltransferase
MFEAHPTYRGQARSFLFGVALPVLSGILASLAAPPFPIWPLIFTAFVPMIIGQHGVLPGSGLP